jgi:hypothetical protein
LVGSNIHSTASEERPSEPTGTLAEQVPEDPKIDYRPWYKYEPEEIAQRYFYLMSLTVVSVGFPPFGRQAGPPESYQYMTPVQRATAEKALAEAKTLVGKFKQITSPENAAYNQRVSWINWIVRQYRGEMFYAPGSLLTGRVQASVRFRGAGGR